MKVLKNTIVAISFVAALGTVVLARANQIVTIGTGGVTGVYYPTGGAICRLVNKSIKEHGILCSVESTGGSIYNINTLRAGKLDMAIVQSDWQYHAYNGSSKFTNLGSFKDLRSIFSVHPELFTVVAQSGKGIKTFNDLKGKRVNIGNPGSGQHGTVGVLMDKMGWNMDDFKQVYELKAGEQSKALCDNKIDAMVYTVGHPSGAIQEATTVCDSVIVEVNNVAAQKLTSENNHYRSATILGGMYRGNTDDVATFGVGATFVSSSEIPEEVIYNVVKSVFENLDDFRRLHPAFTNLKKEEMVSDGLSAPLHRGAQKYYREVGLIQ
ncbi:TAXI family TRAP transporter solute-binding subunit [Candidatus Enterovibrio escicola]|uniref:TRAP transporter solute receptor, TAXI family n=1 Tax=Candidatus Enterovibrio escicola TaxID=1927127 RepID=A0A2A5SZZ6_9GAMM|nr:TAXI family TRAP transporter solute-binding subunit [Candidatus Enterovibrio escacola]PCS21499.1 TRAP transporter solute receptor, TAXI family precursor [Candidatus Enterovibrio escacola]